MGAFGRNLVPSSTDRENRAPRVLMRSRRAMQATLSTLPTSIAGGAVTAFTLTFTNLIAGAASGAAALPNNTRVRVGMLGSTITTDAGGVPFLQIQSAQLQTDAGAICQPLSTGSPLGLANGAALGGELDFDSNDLQYLGGSAVSVSIILTIKNSDSGAHSLNAFTAALFVETVQYDQPLQGEP